MFRRCFAAFVGLASTIALAQIPRPDHVVIVIEENTAEQHIIGNPSAPYINALANSGANFTNFYAITHPSQPNYLHLLSGSAQGVTSDATPTGVPFTTPNWAAALTNSGYTFGGFSETQPTIGFTGDSFTTVLGQNQYVRKHNPWVNWQATGPTIPVNQISPLVNMPLTSFPTDFSLLPTVSVVVPNEQNDMHDGTIQQADNWLQSNLSAYATWAQTHNSLLIVTWDEDDHSQNNKIPTIFSGPMVKNVQTNVNWNLHNLGRTIEDMYGLSHAGVANNVAPIQGIWTNETGPAAQTRTVRHGDNFYASGKDTYIEAANPSAPHAGAATLVADGSPSSQALVRFDQLVGWETNQIPPNAIIKYAKLTLSTGSTAGDQSATAMQLHRMLIPWDQDSTWSSLNNGVSTDNLEALAIADGILTPTVTSEGITFDVTETLKAWVNGASNYGWVIVPTGTDGWRFNSADLPTRTGRPILEVTFIPEPATAAIVALIPFAGARRRNRTIP
ncbi:MAG TPA: alkaline phosphatase family protein [Tepidisphaeraceae bacterium]|jgi:hypothetical protein